MKKRPRDCSWVPTRFENIVPRDFDCSSDSETDYNCIAWAAGKTDRPWWPSPVKPYFWPDGLPKEPIEKAETLANFIEAFKKQEYKVCRSGKFQRGYEKVAIYVGSNGRPLHAARLLPRGIWSSKLGDEEDIEHKTLECIEGKEYGRVKAFLKRPLPKERETHPLAKFRSFLSKRFEKRPKGFSPIPKENPTAG